METSNQLGKSYWFDTTLHGLKFLQIFDKRQKILLITTVLTGLTLLALASYFTSLVIFVALFLLGAMLGWFFYWKRVCKTKLIKLYYLLKETNDVYLWVEKWDLKEKYIYSNPDYYYLEGTELVRVYDNINTYDDPDKEFPLPIPFRPFDSDISTVTTLDLARTQEQSAAERLFTSLRKNWSETLKLGLYVVIIIALLVGCIALLGE